MFGIVSSSLYVQAQKEAAQWYFGQYAALDFNSATPKAMNNSGLFSEEGCISIADANGKLLFYTDGQNVWNKNNSIMPNGQNLRGSASSTQSSIVVQSIDNGSKYYLFVVEKEGIGGLSYSIIDMSLNNGLGDIQSGFKNIPLRNAMTEKLTAAKHINGRDIWLIAHDWGSNAFASFLVTAEGVNTMPVVSNTGRIHKGSKVNAQGAMKASADGKRIALALQEDSSVELFDFDNATGKVSNPMQIQFPANSYAYGLEFSPNSNLLYVSTAGTGKIYQLNVMHAKVEDVQKSQQLVASTPNGEWVGALQMANNGKIYFPIYKTAYLGVINAPNNLGEACNAKVNAISFASNNNRAAARLGLPNYPAYYFSNYHKDLALNRQNPNNNSGIVTVANTKAPMKEIVIADFDASKNKTLKKGETLKFKSLNFDVDKSIIKNSSFKELDALVTILKANPSYNLEISGHTDNTGSDKYNMQLSKERAEAVRAYLIKKGIKSNRITAKGYGSSQPISSNATPEGKLKNRRVVFSLK